MAEQGSLTIYDRSGRQVASTGNNNNMQVAGPASNFPNHATFGIKDGVAKKAFFYSGPNDSATAQIAMGICYNLASK